MSIQQNFPAITPSLSLNFARSKTLDPRITFSRTSTATRVNEVGLIEVMSADEPRFDHEYDSSTGAVKSLGLLVEEERTNLTENSETLSDYSNTRVSNNTISTGGPFGTGYHEKTITEVGSQYNFHVNNQISITTGQTITFSIFFRNVNINVNQIYLRFWTGTGRAWTTQRQVRYNLTNLTTSVSSGTIVNSSIQEFPDDWYRLSMTATADQDGFTADSFLTSSNSIGEQYQLMGAQVEIGSFPTSHIPTSGSTVTRNPDNVSMTGDNFSDWCNLNEGTFYASASILGKNIHTTGVEYPNGICKISDTGSSLSFSRVLFFSGESEPDRVSFGNRDSSSSKTVHDNTFGDIQSNQYYKVCGAYINNDEQAMCLNGRDIKFNGTNVNPPTPNQLLIGTGYNGAIGQAPGGDEMYLNGHISQLTYYPRRLTNTQLQNLTK